MNSLNKLKSFNRLAFHAGIAPFGAAVTTYLWAILLGEGQWLFWQSWSAFTDSAFYGGLSYCTLAGLGWLTIKGADALIESIRKIGYTEGLEVNRSANIQVGRREGMTNALDELWRLAEDPATKTLIRLVANNHEINVPSIGGGPTMTARLTVISPWDNLWRRLADATAELRKRFGDEYDGQVDKMVRVAIGAAVADLEKQIQRMRELDQRRENGKDSTGTTDPRAVEKRSSIGKA